MSDKVVTGIDAESGIGTITFNRPQVLNALDGEAIASFRGACERLADDAAARVVVLRGAGPAFLSGGDVAVFHASIAQAPQLAGRTIADLNAAILVLRRMPKPVLAVVHGAVAGAGLSIMAAADLAIAADNTRFALAYSRIGASPDGGATYFLPRIVGLRKALELTLLADPFDAVVARDLGLLNWVVPSDQLDAQAAQIARRLAEGPAIAYAETKRLLNESFDNGLPAQLAAESGAFVECVKSRDFAEGVAAFVEKRAAKFGNQG
jgi:2-(1,2-epoxy-1,2-dihydrophenyl)acetyl-CoA isomerase